MFLCWLHHYSSHPAFLVPFIFLHFYCTNVLWCLVTSYSSYCSYLYIAFFLSSAKKKKLKLWHKNEIETTSELEASQEQANQERAERQWMCKVLETAEADVADLREDLDQACWELEECHCDVERNA